MAPTIRTCSLLAAALLASSPAAAASGRIQLARPSEAETFVGARAAELTGDARRAAALYAILAESEPGNAVIANRAISQAISAGDMSLALRLAGSRPATNLAPDGRLLLTAERLKAGKARDAIKLLQLSEGQADLSFIAPFVAAWDSRKLKQSLELLSQVPQASAVAAYIPEHRALLLLRARKIADAEPFVTRAISAAGGRETRLRLAFADAYVRAGDKARAMAMLSASDAALADARRRVAEGRRPGSGIDGAAQAYSELLTALAIDLSRAQVPSLPVAMAQIARYSSPANPAAPVLLGILLSDEDRLDDALIALRTVSDGDPLASQAHDAEVRALARADRLDEALARAAAFVASSSATANDWSRLGDALDAKARTDEAADAYGRAIALVQAGGPGPELWQLLLLRGAMLEQKDRWPAAKASLEAARRLAPQNAIILNYLGYAQLEREENVPQAEVMIAEAHRLAPDDASITDSLGWAQFKQGRVDEAISTLQRAAASDPSETEIHEHLGDALYTAGRRFEARYAWRAALVTAEDDVKTRIEAKISAGLNGANAAP